MYKLGNVSAHWHQEIELIYVLEGQVEIVSNEQIFVLNEDDIYLTNAYSNHQLQSENAVILSLEINMEKLFLISELLIFNNF